MLVARDGHVTVEPLGKVLATDCAWVDLKGWDPDALKNVCEQLHISAELPAGWEREPTRAAFASRGDLLALVVFTPEGENLRAVALMTGPNWMITMHAEAVPAVESVWQDALPCDG